MPEDGLHQEFAEPPALVFREDKNVAQIGKSREIRHDPRESYLTVAFIEPETHGVLYRGPGLIERPFPGPIRFTGQESVYDLDLQPRFIGRDREIFSCCFYRFDHYPEKNTECDRPRDFFDTAKARRACSSRQIPTIRKL